jgi:hypothetical protein
MLHELCTGEYTVFTVVNRAPKDDYIKRKVQKDRKKLLKLLNAILLDREVIITYMEDEIEKTTVASLIETFDEFPNMPLSTEIVNNQAVLEMQYCFMYERPSRTQIVIHADQITKFIVRTEGLSELSKSIRFNGP